MAAKTQAQYQALAAKKGITVASGVVSKGGQTIGTLKSGGSTAPVSTVSSAKANNQAIQQANVAKSNANKAVGTSTTDLYGDKTFKAKTGQYKGAGLQTSAGTKIENPTKQALDPNLTKFGKDAYSLSETDMGKRNDILAGNAMVGGIKDEAGLKSFLEGQAGFTNSSAEEQANTVKAIGLRMGIGGTPPAETTAEVPPTTETTPDVTGGDGSWALGYGKMSDNAKAKFDALPKEEQEYLDNLYGEALNDDIMAVYESKRTKEFLGEQRDYQIQITDLQGNIQTIQGSQRLRDAGKQVDNLIQNYAYLGQMGAPGVSAVHLQAQKDNVKEAETKFAEMKQIESDLAQIRALGKKVDTSAYEKQIADINDELNQQVSLAVQNALNSMSAADMAGQLDTLEGVNTFKRSLLVDLDNSIAKYSKGSSAQMAELTKYYTDIADQAREDIKLYKANEGVLDEARSAGGFMVDKNNNPMYDKAGNTIPFNPNMKTSIDWDSGKMIQYNEQTGEFKVQDIVKQSTYAQQTGNAVIEQVKLGLMTSEQAIKILGQDGYLNALTNYSSSSSGPAVDRNTQIANIRNASASGANLVEGIATGVSDGTVQGQCGYFANNISQALGKGKLFGNSLASKMAQKNSDTPVLGGFVIMDTGVKLSDGTPAGHVGYVTAINSDGTITIKDSNRQGDEKAMTHTLDADQMKMVKGYVNLAGTTKTMSGTEDGITQGTQTYGKTFTDTQKNMMNGIDAKNITKGEQAMLSKAGLTESDVYDYKASLKAGKWTQGLDDNEIKRVNTVIDDLTTHQVSKTFQKTQEAYIFAKDVAEGVGSTDNQALIYAFAKAMDPDSVVREGEYATVQKYSQTWGDKLDMDINRVLNGQEFISETAKKNIVETIKTKYKASETAYNQIRKNKIKLINDITGKDIGETVLPSDVIDFTDTTQDQQGTTSGGGRGL